MKKKKKGAKLWRPKKHTRVCIKTQDHTHINTGRTWTQEENNQGEKMFT
jgi:hypothetical protein